MLGENPKTIRESTEFLLEASKAIGLEVNHEKTKLSKFVMKLLKTGNNDEMEKGNRSNCDLAARIQTICRRYGNRKPQFQVTQSAH
ncbi:hypothetical protein ANN_09445 [Periplaneta americana]|uniref:Reverse transcriptase domain-containing protein n=1 Tax=Periplaneta americana TaxID=6978 RepID=A0ABQ8TNK0_PERAM|nr:hypothetical protein ANN_09445 [Periplaneta americana]